MSSNARADLRMPARGFSKILKESQATQKWQEFRQQFAGRLPLTKKEPGFAFQILMQKFPRRGEVITRRGILYGLWSDQGVRRLEFPAEDGNGTTAILLRSGASMEGWRLNPGDKEPRPLKKEDFFAPLARGIDYSPFDAVTPFVHWEKIVYFGSGRVIGRPAHLFTCFPPQEIRESQPDVGFVRVAVDSAYNALLRVEVFGKRGVAERKYSVVGFKKVRDVWIVKTIDFIDLRSRDKTRLRIQAAAVDQLFGPEIFSRENLGRSPKISTQTFDFFD
ncbi:MAG: outer membrane lipoprotein-sorting protein [Opitutales bacterium]